MRRVVIPSKSCMGNVKMLVRKKSNRKVLSKWVYKDVKVVFLSVNERMNPTLSDLGHTIKF